MISDLSSLIPALSVLLERVGTGPIELSVSLCDNKELEVLRQRVEALEASLAAERAIRIRSENLFADESVLNNRLMDLCREHGIEVPRYYYERK